MMKKYLIALLFCFISFSFSSKGQVTAGFTSNPQSGCVSVSHPLIVNFTDASTGAGRYRWHYSFDTSNHTASNDTSNVQNPVHTYTVAGNYVVKQVVYGSGIFKDSTYKTVKVTNAPVLRFSTPDTIHFCAPHTVTFTNTSDTNLGCALKFTWQIDTAIKITTHLNQTVAYTFTQPGNYDITLTDSEACNCGINTLVKHSYIHVDSFSSPCFSTNDTSGCGAPYTVHFTNCSANATSYLWKFGDGTSDTSRNPVHIYGATNTTGYTDSLIAYTAVGCPTILSKVHNIKVGHFNPGFYTFLPAVPSIVTSVVCISTQLELYDTTFGASSHRWRFSTTPSDTLVTTSGAIFHTWPVSGVYHVTDSMWNTTGCNGTYAHDIYVAPLPIIDSITSNHPYRCSPPDNSLFKSWVRDSFSHSVIWHFGEPSLGVLDTAYSDSIHIYNSLGKFSPSIKVTDAYGCVSNASYSNFINVNPPFTALNITIDSGCAPYTTAYSDTVSQVGKVLSYYLDSVVYNDGTPTDTGSHITGLHTYSSVGRFMMYNYFHLDTSVGGCSYVDTLLVPVGTLPILANYTHAIPPLDSVCPQTQVRFYDLCSNCNSVTWKVTGIVYHSMDTTIAFSTFGSKFVMYVPNYNGCTDTLRNDSLYVWPPNVGFAVSIPKCNIRDSFLFTNQSSPPAGYTYHYKWSFGDGTSVTTTGTTNVTHVYTADGTYTVTLSDSSLSPNPHGCSNSVYQNVYVFPVLRSDSNFYAPTTLNCKSTPFIFRGTLTQYGLLYNSYLWYYGDGTLASISNTDTTVHTYTSLGQYTPVLVLTTKYGCIDSFKKPNYITIEAPYKGLNVNGAGTSSSIPVVGCSYFNVHLHDSVSAFPGTTLTKRRWNFNAAPVVTGVNTPPTSSVAGTVLQTDTTISFPVGLYHVVVLDTDNLGCGSIDSVQINSVKPHSYFTSNDTVACTHVSIHFHDTTTNVNYNWIFGDNSGLITSSSTDTSHIYTQNGTYSDTLITISNGIGSLPPGCRDTSIRTNYIAIGNSSVNAGFTFSGSSSAICPPLTAHTVNTSTSLYSNFYKWRNGLDSSIYTTTNPLFTYSYPGTYNLMLIDSNTLGCKDTAYGTVTIGGPTGTLTFTPDTICAHQSALLHVASSVLTAGVDTPFIWSVGYGTYSTDTSGFIATYPTAGTYKPYVIIHQLSSNCNVTVNSLDSIRVNPLPILILPNDSICKNSSVTVTATGANTYSWSPAYGLSATNIPNPVANPTITTTYKVIGTTNHGCNDSVSVNVTVNPTPTVITGTAYVCKGATTSLSNGTTGGTWSSQNTTIATVDPTGLVTGISAGSVTISYTIGNCYGTVIVTVNSLPSNITGIATVCEGSLGTITLSDIDAGGTWSSSNTALATIGSTTGIVTGLVNGNLIITYKFTTTNCYTTTPITVNPRPSAITGTAYICEASEGTTTLSDATTLGTWSSSNTAIATIDVTTGVVTGVAHGNATITYALSGTGCYVTTIATINPLPAIITGNAYVCSASEGVSVLYDVTFFGTWSSSNTLLATIGATTGIVTGIAVGTPIITYQITASGCYQTVPVTVNPMPSNITGIATVCTSSQGVTTLSDVDAGGTWSSSNTTFATIDPVTGVVTGITTSVPTITYKFTGSNCYTTIPVTVNSLPAVITGTASLCEGSEGTTTLSDATSLGTWSSSNTALATVGSTTGIVNGVAFGSPVISYIVTATGCYRTTILTVNPIPSTITGTAIICESAEGTTTLSDATGGGLWSSSNTTLATVGSGTGVVTGVAFGNPIITYKISATNCYTTTTITVNPRPAVITGTASVCEGSEGTTTLSDATPLGTWASSNTALATIGATTGIVTGFAFGTLTVSYTNTATGCYRTTILTVNPVPASITGTAVVCEGGEGTTTLSDAVGGGTWSSSDITLATVGAGSGVVTGVASGVPIITYKFTATNCYATIPVTVNGKPAPITGTMYVCEAGEGTTTLSDATTLGTWASSNTALATIDPVTGIVSGVFHGTPTITYSLTATGCYVTTVVTINPKPAAITGSAYICSASQGTTTLHDATTLGTWASSNTTLATIGASTGVVTGLLAGTPIISYQLTTSGCYITIPVTVNPVPSAISGIATVCESSEGVTTLSDVDAGGTWSSSSLGQATVGLTTGIVTGISNGNPTITYKFTATNCYTTTTITVNPIPAVITGTARVCEGSEGTTTLSDATALGTWSSSNPALATVGATTGIVTGVAFGAPTISYILTTSGCYRTTTFTVNPVPAAITGTAVICEGGEGTTTLSETVSGGTWSSSDITFATVGSGSGVVTGVASGVPIITYKLTATNCYTTIPVTVNGKPVPITGTMYLCEAGEGTTTLNDATTSGTWASGNTAIATIDPSLGIVTGVSHGTTTITYSLTATGCYVTSVITINPKPAVITGTAYICNASEGTTTLSDATTLGTWASSNTSLATIGATTGIVTGLLVGTPIITYQLTSSGCYQTIPVTVNPVPSAITGVTAVCESSETTTTLSDVDAGGTWSSSNTAQATIGSTTGIITGLVNGNPTITYKFTATNCYTTTPITVNPRPVAIIGTAYICEASEGTTTLSDATALGTWSSSNTALATIDATTGVVTGLAFGSPTISYIITATGCYRTTTLTVNPVPAAITGTAVICEGGEGTTTLSESVSGGTWSSSDITFATVGAGSGVVTGVASGVPIITYKLTATNCYTTIPVTVNGKPVPITGTMYVCEAGEGTTTMSDATTLGAWASSNTALATIDPVTGVVTGVSHGTPTITYSLTGTGCYITSVITINPKPALITGTAYICNASEGTTTLSDATTLGTWASSNTSLATIGATTGIVTGLLVGTPIITYQLTSSGCYQTIPVTVNPVPSAITGVTAVCESSETTTTLSDVDAGGTWSSSNTAQATIGSTTGIITGLVNGNPTITYKFTATNCYTTTPITVNPRPAAITGTAVICEASEGTTTLSDATTLGTWSSSNTALATIDATTGVVTGLAFGSPTISYIITATGCYRTTTLTVNPVPAAITGTAVICEGGEGTTTLSESVGGGTWSSSDITFATVGSGSGVVTGVASGVPIITYKFTATNCYATIPVTVNGKPAPITGTMYVCETSEGTTTLSDATTLGTWASSNTAIATIDPSLGIVTGVSHGTTTITYSLSATGCYVTTIVTINPKPAAITGTAYICNASEGTTTLHDVTPFGTWASSNSSLATIDATTGVVTGLLVGTPIITYQITSSGCYQTIPVTVNPVPSAITGINSVCANSQGTTTLSDVDGGGTWSSSNTTFATIDPVTGVVTGLTSSVPIITYKFTSSNCYTTIPVTVNSLPALITGTTSVCEASEGTTTLSDATLLGTWASSNTSLATIDATTGIVTGLAFGSPIISYTIIATGCYRTTILTVNPVPAVVTGTAVICEGGEGTTTLSDAVGGGTWSSNNITLATVGSGSGVVTGVASGVPIITYKLTATNCYATIPVTVNSKPSPITGTMNVCEANEGTTSLSDAITTGTWASNNTAIATIDPSLGIVTGVIHGTTTITYTLSTTSCYATTVITVNPKPATITGNAYICNTSEGTTTLYDATTLGTWASSNTSLATIDATTGVVTGILVGTPIITYQLTASGCYQTIPLTVNPVPSAITGTTSVCESSEGVTTLSDVDAGGTWSSSNTAQATIGSTTGIVTGLVNGNPTITYKFTATNCYATTPITVNPRPAAITGTASICEASEGITTLSDATLLGTWTSNNTAIATIDPVTGIVTGVANGNTFISYTINATSCYRTVLLTINPLPATITGVPNVCSGGEGTTNLGNAIAGGIWTSSNTTVATVGATTGVVAGLNTGTSIITYQLTATGCYQQLTITVDTTPVAITGVANICNYATKTLSDGTIGGTWSSNRSDIASISGSGTSVAVTGLTAGTEIISYNIGSCYAVFPVIIHTQPVPIIGSFGICNHDYTNLYDATTGGVWSSNNPLVATISATGGTLLGMSADTTTITYTYDNCMATVVVTVNAAPYPIIGNTHLCTGTPATYTDAETGGIWSNSTAAVAIFSTTGGAICTLNPIAAGTTILSYTKGSCYKILPVSVSVQPAAIVGNNYVCNNSSLQLNDLISGGKWVSTDTALATIDSVSGLVIGKAIGLDTITYSNNNCYVTKTLSVDAQPLPIFGTPNVLCNGSTTTLFDNTNGGTWTSSNPLVATVTPTGIETFVNSITPGTAIISYSIGNCFDTALITVNTQPKSIDGATAICNYSTITLSDLIGGGKWVSIDTFVATIDSNTGIGIAKTVGQSVISYSIGNCYKITTITVNPQPAPITMLGGSHAICTNDTVTLRDDSLSGQWKSANILKAIISPISGLVTGKNTSIVSDTTTIFYSLGNCSVNKTITVNPIPVFSVRDTTTCRYLPATLIVSGANSYTWAPSLGLSCNTCATTIANPGFTTIYTITGTSLQGCVSDTVLKDSMDVVPTFTPVGRDTICAGETDTLSATGLVSFFWYPSAGLSCTNCDTTFAQPMTTILYSVVGTDIIGCHDTTTLKVTVQQLPMLTSTLTPPFICTGSMFSYLDTSSIQAATITWHRNQMIGITPATSSGTGDIHEVLNNTTQTDDTAKYVYWLTYLGCTDSQIVTVVVEPIPIAPVITTTSAAIVCANTLYQNFGAQNAEPTGIQYSWSVTNGTIWSEDPDRQNCLVNFTSPGVAYVKLSANIVGDACYSVDSFKVEVTNNQSPLINVVYDNNNFVCLLNTADSFQWGYDDAITLQSTILVGERNQNYYNNNPDFGKKHYWVRTSKDGCNQKSYYNAPSGIINVGSIELPIVKVFPNPAENKIEVELENLQSDNIVIQITDVSGKLVKSIIGKNQTEIEISNLSNGFYFISCYNNGIFVASTKFVKAIGFK